MSAQLVLRYKIVSNYIYLDASINKARQKPQLIMRRATNRKKSYGHEYIHYGFLIYLLVPVLIDLLKRNLMQDNSTSSEKAASSIPARREGTDHTACLA